MSHCLVTETFESKARVRVPKGNSSLLREVPRSTYSPNASSILSAENFSNFRSSDAETTRDVSKNCHSMDLSDGIWGRETNSFHSLLKPKCSLHLSAFIIRKLKQIRGKAALARNRCMLYSGKGNKECQFRYHSS